MHHVIKTARRIAVAAAIAITSASAFVTPTNSIDNGGFETPTQIAGNFAYLNGLVNSWTYVNAGVATSNSPFNLVNAAGQAGLLQQAGSSISQVFNFTDNILALTFSAEGRGYSYGANPISVLIDGTALVFNGSTTVLPGSTSSFITHTSNVIALTAGSHTLNFVGNGLNGADVTTFIDNVALTTAVPEPVTLGLVALGAARRKAKQA